MTRPANINPAMGVSEWAMLVTLSLLWGGSFFFVAIAVGSVPALTIVFIRVAVAAVVLIGVVHVIGQRLPASPRIWFMFAIMGALNNAIPFTLIVWGQGHIASALASILNATTPVFSVIVANYLADNETITPARLAGVIVGLAGVAVMVGADALAGLGAGLAAQLAILAAAISYAFAGVYGRHFARLGLAPVVTAAGQVSASSLLLAAMVLVIDKPWMLIMPGPVVWVSLLALAVLSTACAYVLYFRILATAGATNLLLVTLLIPLSAITLGIAFLGEVLHWRHIAGMLAIAVGLALLDGRPVRYLGLAGNRAGR